MANNPQIISPDDEYINIDILVHSLVFSLNIKEYVNFIKLENISVKMLFLYLYNYIQRNRNEEIYDKKTKENIYFLIDYIKDRDNETDKIIQNENINEIKIILNNASNYNLDFIREQIIVRDSDYKHYASNLRKIRRIPDQTIEELKDIYYLSISNDIIIFELLFNDNNFQGTYKNHLLSKTFYRSLNYLMICLKDLFIQEPDALNNAKFIIEENLKLLYNSEKNDAKKCVEQLDEEFFDIADVAQKMVKKLEREIR